MKLNKKQILALACIIIIQCCTSYYTYNVITGKFINVEKTMMFISYTIITIVLTLMLEFVFKNID